MLRSSLDVRDLQVEFLPEKKVRVRGRIRCTGLRQQDEGLQAWISVRVDVDFPEGSRGFRLLPEEWSGEVTNAMDRGHASIGWIHRGKWYPRRLPEAFFFSNTLRVGPAVRDKHLDDEKDEGRWISFDGTLDFERVLAKDRQQYRIVIGWTLHTMDGYG